MKQMMNQKQGQTVFNFNFNFSLIVSISIQLLVSFETWIVPQLYLVWVKMYKSSQNQIYLSKIKNVSWYSVFILRKIVVCMVAELVMSILTRMKPSATGTEKLKKTWKTTSKFSQSGNSCHLGWHTRLRRPKLLPWISLEVGVLTHLMMVVPTT